MKIKTLQITYENLLKIKKPTHIKPLKPLFILGLLIRLISIPDFIATKFKSTGKFPKNIGPCLILMNHSSFIDLKIAYKLLFPRRFCIVSTYDAFIGKRLLMRLLGCIPTRKFVSDFNLISDIKYMLFKKKTNVLMFPEAGYSFDGTATTLPKHLGTLLKRLGVPVVFIKTEGAFTHDPLYNGLQKRKVPVSATVEILFTKEQLNDLSNDEINKIIDKAFTFDSFEWQKKNNIKVDEPFRADGLERILYKCPHCHTEGKTVGKGTRLTCTNCGTTYELNEYGSIYAINNDTIFTHIPTWYSWERSLVRNEIERNEYYLNVPVKIGVLVDYKAIYFIGNGTLTHTAEGFCLTSSDGKLKYKQKTKASYGLNADYFWYELGDVVGIGDNNALYYCFPPKEVSVAKVRLAAEEMYKLEKERIKISKLSI